MTQVVTVSAHTAAYASEGTAKQPRISRSSFIEENTRILAASAARSDDYQLRALMNVIQPPALALYFLTASQQKLGQATVDETIAAYRGATG